MSPNDAYDVSYYVSQYSDALQALNELSIATLILGWLLSMAIAILLDGVLGYCYVAFFVRLTELKGSRPLTFSDFLEGFSSAVKAALAYIWQQIWLFIWGLILLPGVLLMGVGLMVGGSDAIGLLVVLGVALYFAALVWLLIVYLRYGFIYQLIADGRGKVGPRQALRYSVAITTGHIGELLVFYLSFIPWFLLGAVTFGIAMFYAYPYLYTSEVLVYRWLRDQAFREGKLDPAALGYVQANRSAQANMNDTVIDI